MKKNIMIFVLGLIVGLFLYSQFQSKKEVSSDAHGENITQKDSSELRQEDITISHPSALPRASITSVETRTHAPEAPRPPENAPSPPKRLLKFDVSEFQLQRMETDLEEMQKEVSLFREEKGWRVKFQGEHNPLADMGLRDGDLIQFSHLESMKRNSQTTDLIRRLENVLTRLER